MTKTAITDRILKDIEDTIDEVEDEQSLHSARDDTASYSKNLTQKVLLKNAHIMVCNAFDEKSKFDK